MCGHVLKFEKIGDSPRRSTFLIYKCENVLRGSFKNAPNMVYLGATGSPFFCYGKRIYLYDQSVGTLEIGATNEILSRQNRFLSQFWTSKMTLESQSFLMLIFSAFSKTTLNASRFVLAYGVSKIKSWLFLYRLANACKTRIRRNRIWISTDCCNSKAKGKTLNSELVDIISVETR